MKRLSIIAIAAAALASAACTQERNIVPADPGVTTVTATHFAASTRSSIEADLSGEAPAYEILWDTPDKILVGYPGAVATFTSTNTEPAAEATFTGKLPEGSGTLYGIYPAKASNKVNSDGSFSIAFKAEQKAIPGSYDPESFPAVAESRSKDLSFQNICSLLALTVEDEGIVTITLKGNGGACFYGGTFTVVTASGDPEIDDFTEDVYEITLTADGTFDPEETYYMSVPPITFEDGVVFTLTYEDGTTADVVLANEVTAERSKVHQVSLIAGDTPDDPYTGHEYVDMGDGLKWATMNVGSTMPEDYGDYFAWGETTGYLSGKGNFTWDYYKWMQEGQSSWEYITKYTCDDGQTEGIWYYKEYDGEEIMNSSFVGDNGDGVEHKDFASYDYADDAARANWGGTWRTPTEEEWTWLVNNCTWEWTLKRIDNVEYYGVIVTSNINGNSLYLPCAGYMAGSYTIWNRGDEASYWSSSLNTSDSSRAMVMFFYYSWDSPRMDKSLRCRGFSVRPVAE